MCNIRIFIIFSVRRAVLHIAVCSNFIFVELCSVVVCFEYREMKKSEVFAGQENRRTRKAYILWLFWMSRKTSCFTVAMTWAAYSQMHCMSMFSDAEAISAIIYRVGGSALKCQTNCPKRFVQTALCFSCPNVVHKCSGSSWYYIWS